MKCFILAGGKSRRFGEDKLLYEIEGKKVIERVVGSAKSVCDEVFIVTKNPVKFEFLKIPVILDKLPIQASIVGLYTALSHADEPVLILSGDLPLISPQVLKILMDSYEEPVTLAKTKDKLHTLIGVYSPKVTQTIKEFLRKKNYKLYKLVKKVGFKAVGFPDEYAPYFLNLNTKEDLRILREIKVN